jgi:hypothetical protein
LVNNCLLLPTDSLMLYADTGGGKTAQLGELAEHVALTTGKKTILWTADRGGVETVRPHIDAGIIDVESLLIGDPWVAIHAAACGKRYDRTKAQWIPADLQPYGLAAYEGMASMGEAVRIAMAADNATGQGVGGKAAFIVKKGSGQDAVSVAGSTMTDYGVIQAFITAEAWRSQALGLPVLWTSHVSRGNDEENNSPIVGVSVAGKALTAIVPRWFTYTFRLEALPVPAGRPRHLLYIEEHTDTGLKGFGNARIPLASVAGFKPVIEPASIVEALKQIRAAQKSAGDVISQRLKAAGVTIK